MTSPQPSASGLPFDDVRALIARMPDGDEAAADAVRDRLKQLDQPADSLGALEDLAIWLATWRGAFPTPVERALVAVFAGNHGVALTDGVSASTPDVTQKVVERLAGGGASVSQIASRASAGLKVFELALDLPTPNITEQDALGEAECAATIAFGMEALAEGVDLLALGAVGMGGTTAAAAVAAGLYGGDPLFWARVGSISSGAHLSAKVDVIQKALARNRGMLDDPLEVMRRLGGREIAAIAGAIIAARHQKVPVILDGYVSCVAAAVLHEIDPRAVEHCIAGSVSRKPAHRALLDRLQKKPILDMGLGLGDGSGAALAISLIQSAADVAAHSAVR